MIRKRDFGMRECVKSYRGRMENKAGMGDDLYDSSPGFGSDGE